MARATTEIFAEMTVEIETTGGALPVAQNITTIAVPGIITPADITKFVINDIVLISGFTGANAVKNGYYKVGTVTTSFAALAAPGGIALDITGSTPTPPWNQTNMPGMSILPAAPATFAWSKICGITSRTVNRTTTMQSTEIPDCSDETLPNSIEKSVQSQEQTISGTGVWAAQSHGTMMDWWRLGTRKTVRVGNLKALTGTVIYEYGPAFLTQLNNTAEKGPKVTSEIQIEFDGLPYISVAP